ncbi:MAG: hypothetical protein R3B49_09650 [Phycisphaerales bacterium]
MAITTGSQLPGVAPCYIEVETTPDGWALRVDRRSLRGAFGLLGGFMLVLGLIVAGFSGAWLVRHAPGLTWISALKFAIRFVVGLACVASSAWFFQMIASEEMLSTSESGILFGRRRWWRWRDTVIDRECLEIAVLWGRMRRGPTLRVVAIRRDSRALFLIAADRKKHAAEVSDYARRTATQTGLPLVETEDTIEVGGDVRLTKW